MLWLVSEMWSNRLTPSMTKILTLTMVLLEVLEVTMVITIIINNGEEE
jgi:hypothetical protein